MFGGRASGAVLRQHIAMTGIRDISEGLLHVSFEAVLCRETNELMSETIVTSLPTFIGFLARVADLIRKIVIHMTTVIALSRCGRGTLRARLAARII